MSTNLNKALARLFGRIVLNGLLIHRTFRSVPALTPQLGPWEHLPQAVQGYYQDVARFLAEELQICQGCGEWQLYSEYLERCGPHLLCQACRLPSPLSWEQEQEGDV